MAEFFGGLTEEDLRFRFLTRLRQVSHERLVEMTHVDHDRTEKFLAFVAGDDMVIATGMLAMDSKLEARRSACRDPNRVSQARGRTPAS